MRMYNTVQYCAIAFGVFDALLRGCAAQYLPNEPIQFGNRDKPEDKPKQEAVPQTEAKGYATLEQAKKKLKVDYDNLAVLPNGYKTTKANAELLRNIAGVLAGTAEVTRIEDGYAVLGEYSYAESPGVLDDLCADADANNDGILTVDETVTHARKVYAERVKK